MVTLEEFEIAAKYLAKAFRNLDAITDCIDDGDLDEARLCRDVGTNAIRIIKEYWIETASKRLWGLHIEGPDDMYAAPSEEDARATAFALNMLLEQMPFTAKMVLKAVVVEWPYSAADHADGIEEWNELTSGVPNVELRGCAAFAQSRLSVGLELLWIGDAKVAANLNRQVIVDFIMPWNSTASV